MVLNRVNAGNRGIGNSSNAGVGLHSKRIQASLSTQIIIQVEEAGQKFVVGAVQSLGITQSRPLGNVTEVGTDALIGIVPTGATTYTADIQRIVFDFQKLPQALQREYRHIHSQRRPFDIVITDYNPYLAANNEPTGGDTNNDGGGGGTEVDDQGAVTPDATAVETTLKNCWFENLAVTYETGNYLITERAAIRFEHIFDNVTAKTLAGDRDRLERLSNTSNSASVMSGFDGTRNP